MWLRATRLFEHYNFLWPIVFLIFFFVVSSREVSVTARGKFRQSPWFIDLYRPRWGWTFWHWSFPNFQVQVDGPMSHKPGLSRSGGDDSQSFSGHFEVIFEDGHSRTLLVMSKQKHYSWTLYSRLPSVHFQVVDLPHMVEKNGIHWNLSEKSNHLYARPNPRSVDFWFNYKPIHKYTQILHAVVCTMDQGRKQNHPQHLAILPSTSSCDVSSTIFKSLQLVSRLSVGVENRRTFWRTHTTHKFAPTQK